MYTSDHISGCRLYKCKIQNFQNKILFCINISGIDGSDRQTRRKLLAAKKNPACASNAHGYIIFLGIQVPATALNMR